MKFRSLVMSIMFLLLQRNALADVVSFSTSDFVESEWATELFPGSAGSASASTVLTGGNPGAHRQLSLTVGPGQSVLAEQFYTAATFNPSVMGEVTSASIAYDATRISATIAAATQVVEGLAIKQGGQTFIGFAGVTSLTPPTWDGVLASNLVTLFPTVDWINGGEITFGYYDSVSATQTGFTIVGGYDNFAVNINFTPAAVPLPSAGFLFAPAFAGLGFCRRKPS